MTTNKTTKITRRSLLKSAAALLALPATILGATHRNSTSVRDCCTVGKFHPVLEPFEVWYVLGNEYLYDTKLKQNLLVVSREQDSPHFLAPIAADVYALLNSPTLADWEADIPVGHFSIAFENARSLGMSTRALASTHASLAKIRNLVPADRDFFGNHYLGAILYHDVDANFFARTGQHVFERPYPLAAFSATHGILTLFDPPTKRIAFIAMRPKGR